MSARLAPTSVSAPPKLETTPCDPAENQELPQDLIDTLAERRGNSGLTEPRYPKHMRTCEDDSASDEDEPGIAFGVLRDVIRDQRVRLIMNPTKDLDKMMTEGVSTARVGKGHERVDPCGAGVDR